MAKLVALLPFVLLASSCVRTPSDDLARLSQEFVDATLSFSPTAATAAGLHSIGKQNLDGLLDDMSPANLDRQQHFYQDFLDHLNKLDAGQLTPEDRADASLLQDQCALRILDLAEVQSAAHDPMLYAEIIGRGVFAPFVLEYAPKPERIRHIMARLQQVPLFLDQAATNLQSAPVARTWLAMDETQSDILLVDKTVREGVPGDQQEVYGRVAQPALAALRRFQEFLKNRLSERDDQWRLGTDRYSRKLRLTVNGSMAADAVLVNATSDLGKVRARMMELALPLHAAMAPSHGDHADLTGDARQNQVIGEVLAGISEHHSTRDGYLEDARKYLEAARAFVQEKHLLTLPARSNLRMIPTPEFERAIYTAGGFAPAPPLEPQLAAFLWITPIPAAWAAEPADSKLREYNEYMLRLLILHEAIPGHYVQSEIANGIGISARRVLRTIYGSAAYQEGWAQYAEQAMVEEGFLNHSPELELTFAKQELRMAADAILDVRLQMLGMTDQEALEFLEKQAFQEHQEAVEKLQQAKATSALLPTGYVGWAGWIKVRDAMKKARGASFTLAEFHDRALKEGAVPMGALGSLILQGPKQP